MYYTKYLAKVVVLTFAIITLHAINMHAQNFQLLDKDTQKPIAGATYIYGNNSSLTDSLGKITLSYKPEIAMQISHVAYGSWELSDREIQNAFAHGEYKRSISSIHIFPVTIIGMHDKAFREQSIALSYQDQMAHDGAEILTQIPAINGIRKSGNYGTDPVMRGFKYDQLNVVMNGCQSAVAACPNRMDPPTSQMAPNMMGEIEVLKGPHALRYGNAIGGTINFKSFKPRFTNKTTPYGRLTGGYDGNGANKKSEGLMGISGEHYNIGLFGAWASGNDYTDGDGNNVQAHYQRTNYGISSAIKVSKNQTLTLSAANNLAKDVAFASLPMDLRHDNTWMLNAGHNITFTEGALKQWDTRIFGTLVDHAMDNFTKALDPRMVDAETTAKTISYGGRTEGKWYFSDALLYTGADLRTEGADGYRTRTFLMGPNKGKTLTDNVWQDGQITKSGLFAEYHLPQGSFQFIFSGRMELNQAKINNPDPNFETANPLSIKTQWNPGLSVGLTKNTSSQTKVGFWLARVQRSGSLTERYINFFPVGVDPYEMLGNPNLKSETNNQTDLTFAWTTENTKLSVDVFAAYLQNYISSTIDTTLKPKMPTAPGVRRFNNLNNALKTGFETSWTQKLVFGMEHQLGIAYTYAQDLEHNDALAEIAPLDVRYTVYGNYLKSKLRPEIVLRYVAEQNRVSTAFGETKSPAFTLLDVKIAYKLYKNISLATGVQNLFNQAYYEHLSRAVQGSTPKPIYAPGRNVFITLHWDIM